jgi:hypothetical protein
MIDSDLHASQTVAAQGACEAIHEPTPSLADSIIKVQKAERGKCHTFPFLMPVTAREPAACIGDEERIELGGGLEVACFQQPRPAQPRAKAAPSVAEARRIAAASQAVQAW